MIMTAERGIMVKNLRPTSPQERQDKTAPLRVAREALAPVDILARAIKGRLNLLCLFPTDRKN